MVCGWQEGGTFHSSHKQRAGLPQDFGGDGSVKCGEGVFLLERLDGQGQIFDSARMRAGGEACGLRSWFCCRAHALNQVPFANGPFVDNQEMMSPT